MATQYRKFPYVSATVSVGDVSIQFDLDGVATSVSKDTVVPANSRPLPVEVLGEVATTNAILDACVTSDKVQVDVVTIPSITIASMPDVTIASLPYLEIVDFLDSGLVDASSTAITTAGLTVVASLASNIKKIAIFEDIGEFMALTNGADAILAYLPLGGGEIDIVANAATALKLKSLTGSSITSGKIAMNFLG